MTSLRFYFYSASHRSLADIILKLLACPAVHLSSAHSSENAGGNATVGLFKLIKHILCDLTVCMTRFGTFALHNSKLCTLGTAEDVSFGSQHHRSYDRKITL